MVIMWTSQFFNMILQITSFTPLYNTFSHINLNMVEIFTLLHQCNAVMYVDNIKYSIKSKLAAVFDQNKYPDNLMYIWHQLYYLFLSHTGNELIPCSSLQETNSCSAGQEMSYFYQTSRFITVIIACHWNLIVREMNSIHMSSHPIHFKINFSSMHATCPTNHLKSTNHKARNFPQALLLLLF